MVKLELLFSGPVYFCPLSGGTKLASTVPEADKKTEAKVETSPATTATETAAAAGTEGKSPPEMNWRHYLLNEPRIISSMIHCAVQSCPDHLDSSPRVNLEFARLLNRV